MLPRLRDIVAAMFHRVPTGVGSSRRDLRLSKQDLRRVLEQGAGWAVQQGFGERRDLEVVEEDEAKQVFEYLRQMGELAELELPEPREPRPS